MDDYVTKPVQPALLYQAIETQIGGASAPAPDPVPCSEEPGEPADAGAPVFDREELLARLDGDLELLAELAGIFREEASELLAAVTDAVEARDSPALQRAAHSLKGCAANLCAPAATEAAQRLEKMGRDGMVDEARPAVACLIADLDRLQSALAPLAMAEIARSV